MTVTSKLKPGDKPTKEQIKRIETAAQMPVAHDNDSPVYTYDQLIYLYQEAKKLNKKHTVGIRLNQKTLEQYKSLGKGYTGIMAAVLDYAINHPKILKEAL
ncbi:MAG: BrnA antitoxin family protein [Treponema sp.]|nr:BrnA antitoxin family protein [Treponema sp.]